MPTDLQDRLEELVAPPAPPRFREELHDRATAAERRSARLRRVAAIAAGTAALAAATGTGVHAFGRGPALSGTVDRTVSCPIQVSGGIPVFTLRAEPVTQMKQFGKLGGVPAQLHVQTGLTGFGTYTELLGLSSHTRGWGPPDASCHTAARIPLARGGLPLVGAFTRNHPGLNGDTGARCFSGTSIVARLRVKLVGQTQPVAAQLAIRTGKKLRPLAYVDWTPSKVTVYATDDCN